LAHFMLREMIAVLKGLQVYPKNMMENIWKTRGLIFSQRVLLALVDKGLPRETAYKIVKLNSMRVWNDKHLNLKDLLLEDKEINARISDKEIEALFKLDYHLKHVKTIFKRVLGGK